MNNSEIRDWLLFCNVVNHIAEFNKIRSVSSAYVSYSFDSDNKVSLSYNNGRSISDYVVPDYLVFDISTIFENELKLLESNLKLLNDDINIFIKNDVNVKIDADIIKYNIIYNFKQKYYRAALECWIGTLNIVNIPLRFMMNMNSNDIQIFNNKIYIKIPFNLFMDGINLPKLSFYESPVVNFRLTNENNTLPSCELLSKNFMMGDIGNESTYSKCFKEDPYNEIIQQLSSEVLFAENTDIQFDISKLGYLKGFYIECENVDLIKEVTFQMHQSLKIHYDEFLIKHKFKKENQQLLYIPMIIDNSDYDRTKTGVEGTLTLHHLCCYLPTKIFITLHKKTNNPVCIYKLTVNSLNMNNDNWHKNKCYLTYGYCDNGENLHK